MEKADTKPETRILSKFVEFGKSNYFHPDVNCFTVYGIPYNLELCKRVLKVSNSC
jgi:hypothetical protein